MHNNPDGIEAGLNAGLNEFSMVKCVPNATIRMASRLIEAGLEAGLKEFFIVKHMQNT